MESSNSAYLVIAAGLLGAIITGSYQFIYDWLKRPKLKLDFLNETDRNIVETSVQQGGAWFNGVYVRVRLRNTGKNPAKQCLVFLTAIEEVHPSGTTPAPFHDTMPLSWSGWNFSPRVVPRGVDFYVDVARVLKEESGWSIRVERLFSNHQKLKDYRGTYRFKLLATADNAEPCEYALDVSYDGDWHNLRAVESAVP